MSSSINDSTRKSWTDEHLKLAFYLYCQLPFGKLDARNQDVKSLASFLDRTPGSVAMKLVNFASLDPAIRESGRKGLGNASAADKRIWDEFHNDWVSLTRECESMYLATSETPTVSDEETQENYIGETREASINLRVGQGFFRKAVIAAYKSRCCMSGVSIPQLLIASHIIPWSEDNLQRLNPRNGLCLSTIHDKAFDSGFITVKPDMTISVSGELTSRENEGEQTRLLVQLHGREISLPHKFQPEPGFLVWHNQNIYRG